MNPQDPPRVKVGVGVMVMKDGQVLLGKRKGAHGEGEYAFPGGHMEFGESFEECARRESKEETGIEIDNVHFGILSNFRHTWPGKHYLHVGLIATWKSGEPKVLEPDRFENWDWYELDHLPQPIFRPCLDSFENYRTGRTYFDR